jgi:hypothetical protein
MKTTKIYVVKKPCKPPKAPQFQWNGYGGINPKYKEISGVTYFEDEIGWYHIIGELECTAD